MGPFDLFNIYIKFLFKFFFSKLSTDLGFCCLYKTIVFSKMFKNWFFDRKEKDLFG